MSDFKVGDRVQWEEDNSICGGTVHLIIPPKQERPENYYSLSEQGRAETHPSVVVHWDDDTAECYNTYETFLEAEDNALEREFRIKAREIKKQIDAKLAEADAALTAATNLADEHGIPFYSHSLSALDQSYFPETFEDKYPEIDNDFLESITGATHRHDYRSGGWEVSDICY